MKKIVLLLIVLFTLFSCNNSKLKNEKIEFKKGDELSKYYNFDNIKIVEINNRHGSRNLNESEINSFKNDLKTYYFHQHNAPTKPGHLDAMVTFKNNEKIMVL